MVSEDDLTEIEDALRRTLERYGLQWALHQVDEQLRAGKEPVTPKGAAPAKKDTFTVVFPYSKAERVTLLLKSLKAVTQDVRDIEREVFKGLSEKSGAEVIQFFSPEHPDAPSSELGKQAALSQSEDDKFREALSKLERRINDAGK